MFYFCCFSVCFSGVRFCFSAVFVVSVRFVVLNLFLFVFMFFVFGLFLFCFCFRFVLFKEIKSLL